MKVTLIHGPAKCGKTRLIVKEFAQEFNKPSSCRGTRPMLRGTHAQAWVGYPEAWVGLGKNPIIIAPSSESVRYIKNLIFSETSLQGFCGYRVITFDHLVNMLMEGCTELSGVGKYFLIRDIVSRMNLRYFLPVKDYRGFYESLSRFIAELKYGEIMPEVFLKGINKKGPTNKDKELYAIYSLYQEELHRLNIYDHEGKFWQTQQLIEKGVLGPFSDCKLLIADGFQNFSPAELKIIQSLSKYVDEIVITLTLDCAHENIFAPTIKTYNLLKKTFKELNEKQMPSIELPRDKIRIVSCPGQVREVEEIAREIKRLIIYSGKKPNDIAVLFRDLTEYRELIIEMFNRYGIPYSISIGMPLIKSPLTKTALRMFESATNIPKRASFNEYVKLLEGLMSGPCIENEKLIEILNNLVILNDKLDSTTFYEMLVYIAESIECPPETYKDGQVQVLDVHRARGLSFPVVFISGLIEKSFPKQIAEEPLYGDIERAQLRRSGVDVEESKEKQKEEAFLFYCAINTASAELYLTYPATDSEGKEELTSYYVDEIKKMYPDLIETKKVPLSSVIPELEDVYTPQHLATRVMYNYWNNTRDSVTMALYKHLGISYLLNIAAIENNRPPPWNGIIIDKTILEKLKNDYGIDYKFSVSQFNEYGTCPFSYFCKRILGLEPIKEPEDEIMPVDEGNLYHAILREYYAEGPSPSPLPPMDIGGEGNRVREISEKHFRIAEQAGLVKNIALWKIKKEEIIGNLENIIQYEKSKPPPLGIKRTPSYFEIPFGMEGKEPLVINGIKIQGKIDRIDLTEPGFFVVVDYKSGGKLISARETLKGTNLQLPIYTMAVKDVLRIGTDALEAYFFYVKRKKYFHANPLIHYTPTKKGLKPNPLWDEYMHKTKEYVVRYAEEIRNGKFPPFPKDKCPPYCDYSDICRHSLITRD